MEVTLIKGQSRPESGRKANNRLRKQGMIPAIVYGHGEAPESIALSLHDIEISLEHKAHVVKVSRDGKDEQFLLKQVQYDHLDKTPIHVDLMRVRADERVHVKVPIEYRGAIKVSGAVLVALLSDLNVECLLLQIPDVIRVTITDLDLGDQVKISDLELPPGVKVLHNPHELVATVRIAGHLEATPTPVEGAEAETKEPEVFGRVAKEEPAEGGEGGAKPEGKAKAEAKK